MRRMSFLTASPTGLVVDGVSLRADGVFIAAHPQAAGATCPDCGRLLTRIHSRYERRLLDLPSQGRAVQLHVQVRRFRCGDIKCPRQIFGEPLTASIAPRAARRTSRLEGIVHHLGIALGGRPAASLAKRPMLPVSRDTLLRVVRRRATPTGDAVRVLRIDDFAWKRGQRYGAVLCDLERRQIIDLLPDREAGTVEAWLAAHPDITVVSRDWGAGYGRAATRAVPRAMQVADRWHLMENASAAFQDAVRRSMCAGINRDRPNLLTCAERLQYMGFVRRQEDSRVIKHLAAGGSSIKTITRQTGRSRKLVRSVLRRGDGDVFRCRARALEPHLAALDADWIAGYRNGAALWRRLRAAGFSGSLRVVTEWAIRRRRGEMAGIEISRIAPPARRLSRLLSLSRDHLSKADAITVAAVECGVPALVTARQLLEQFHLLFRARDLDALIPWLADSTGSLLASFSEGIRSDIAAVRAAITEPWSNGQTEGQITKLKLAKRQMYERAGLDLLRARLLIPAKISTFELHRD